jgi:K+-transporting ATPase ATPase C chain
MRTALSSLARAIPATTTTTPPLADHGLLRGAIGLTLATLIGAGFLYSLAAVGLGQALFPATAGGSLITRDRKVVGSALVAQPFAADRYFQSRPSAAGYNPMAASGSNQARTNPELRKRLDETRTAIAQREGVAPADVPSDLMTQSGSGLDPHISPEAAALQAARVARARGLSPAEVERMLAAHTEPQQLGVLGGARVNVLALNLALDAAAPPLERKP